ncbi:MAG: hypothetical protein JWP04_2831 [Belnapia sp.]|nr:hypothetical protein [Belnapia sp.]
MMRFRIIILPVALLALPAAAVIAPAKAQQTAVVVPAEAGVVIAPRGAAPIATAPLLRRPRRAMPPALVAETNRPDVSPLLAALPLGILAAVLAATLSSGGGGGGGGISAPAQTTR